MGPFLDLKRPPSKLGPKYHVAKAQNYLVKLIAFNFFSGDLCTTGT